MVSFCPAQERLGQVINIRAVAGCMAYSHGPSSLTVQHRSLVVVVNLRISTEARVPGPDWQVGKCAIRGSVGTGLLMNMNKMRKEKF